MLPHNIDNDISLRILQRHHANEVFLVTDANRAHLREWLPWLDHTKEEKDSVEFISSMLKSFAETGAFTCGIWHTGTFCGVIGYNKIDWDNRTAFPGYWLSKSYEGRGIMTRCCQALIEHAFTEYKLNRIVVAVATENHKSQAIPDRLGFRQEGILCEAEWLYDRYVDHTINALLASNRPNKALHLTPTRVTLPAGRYAPVQEARHGQA